MVKDEKRRALAAEWQIGEDLLKNLEDTNDMIKAVAEDLALDTKEEEPAEEPVETKDETKDETDTTPQDGTDVEDETKSDETDDGEPDGAVDETKEEEPEGTEPVADNVSANADFVKQITDALLALHNRLERVEKSLSDSDEVAALKQRVEELENKEETRVQKTRSQSILEMITSASVEGKEETRVDGRTTLAKDGPVESKDRGKTGLFIDDFMN